MESSATKKEQFMNKLYSVCWNITEKCNENCKFCYRTLSPDLDIKKNIIIADKLIEYNVEKITFAGGEPLLYKDIFTIAEYIKNKKPDILLSLTTNGMLIDKTNFDKITKLFDWITFDIDAPNSNYHIQTGRGKDHLDKNLKNIKLMDDKINIKINTVVTKENINQIPMIYEIIKNFNIKRWKILRYYPIAYNAVKNRNIFDITDDEYNELVITLTNICINDNIRLNFNDFIDFETTYFSIFPNGDLKDKNGDVTCNILDKPLNECINSIDLSNHYIKKLKIK